MFLLAGTIKESRQTSQTQLKKRCPMCFYQYFYVFNPFTGFYEYQYRYVCI